MRQPSRYTLPFWREARFGSSPQQILGKAFLAGSTRIGWGPLAWFLAAEDLGPPVTVGGRRGGLGGLRWYWVVAQWDSAAGSWCGLSRLARGPGNRSDGLGRSSWIVVCGGPAEGFRRMIPMLVPISVLGPGWIPLCLAEV